MSLLKRSDFWLAIITIMFFSFLAVVLFGSMITSEPFWIKLGLIFGFSLLAKLTIITLGRLGARMEALGAFAIGATFGLIYQLADRSEAVDFQLVATSGFGFFLLTILFRFHEKRKLSSD